jgi:hypothetical protein
MVAALADSERQQACSTAYSCRGKLQLAAAAALGSAAVCSAFSCLYSVENDFYGLRDGQ